MGIISGALRSIKRLVDRIILAVGTLLDSFVDPLRTLVLTVTEEETRLGLAPVERPATQLFMEFSGYYDEIGDLISEMLEGVFKTLPTMSNVVYVGGSSIIMEFFSKLEFIVVQMFEDPAQAITDFTGAIFSVAVSLIRVLMDIIPSPHEKYAPWSYLPAVRLLLLRTGPYAESIVKSVTSLFSPMIIFVISLMPKSVTNYIQRGIIKGCSGVKSVTLWVNKTFAAILTQASPFIAGIIGTFYKLTEVSIRTILVIIYSTYIWVYTFFRTVTPARAFYDAVENFLELISVSLPGKISTTLYRRLLSAARRIAPV
jgi:hypothetical protein